MNVTYKIVDQSFDGQRLDRWFKYYFPRINHNLLEKLIRKGQIRVDKKRIKSSTKVYLGQSIRIPPLEVFNDNSNNLLNKNLIKYENKVNLNLNLNILYKDEDYLVFNKPYGLPVQGGTNIDNNLDDILSHYKFDYTQKPKLIHRLDKETTGVLVIARTITAARHFSNLLRKREIKKLYWSLVNGVPKKQIGSITEKLYKYNITKDNKKFKENDKRLEAISLYRNIYSIKGFSWMALMPESGRKHQLRIHCAQLGFPIIGDTKYANKLAKPLNINFPNKLHLFARSIEFKSIKDKRVFVQAPIPDHIKKSFKFLDIKIDEFDGDDTLSLEGIYKV